MIPSPLDAVYIHVPFCEKKCTYCDFYSIEATHHIDEYVRTLLREIELRHNDYGTSYQPRTIFFGGGTPSLLTPEHINAILAAFPPPAPDAEITMEANPGTVTCEKLAAFRRCGVNRLSIGVQSFQPEELAFLTRIHTPEQAEQAVYMAREAGFANVNVDLMFSLPGQTQASLANTLHRTLALAPNHISAYSLVYERGTPLYTQMQKGTVTPVPADADADLYYMVSTTLHAAGYEQYEVSNYAQPGLRCQHNLAYWHGKQHLSVGPSAHGLLRGVRYWNHRSLTSWMQLVQRNTLPEANTETLTPEQQLSEFVFLTLRADGLPVKQLLSDHNIDVRSKLGTLLEDLLHSELIRDTGTHIQLTAKGYALCDEITVRILEPLTQP